MTLTQVSIFFNIIIMYIHIFRRRFTPWGVDGTMVINGVIICGTVEHPKNYLHAGDYYTRTYQVQEEDRGGVQEEAP